jgi:hypothetical protein
MSSWLTTDGNLRFGTIFITCILIALESTGATLYKGILRAFGCIIGITRTLLDPRPDPATWRQLLPWSFWSRASRRSPGGSPPELKELLTPFYGLFQGFRLQGDAPNTDLHDLPTNRQARRTSSVLSGIRVQRVAEKRAHGRFWLV